MIVEVVSAIIILGIAILFLNPTHLTMPDSMNSMLILAMIISFLFFSAFILKESSSDERETLHKIAASRISYLVGVGALVLGIVIQALNHNIDAWLVVVLSIMVFSKLISRIYYRFKM